MREFKVIDSASSVEQLRLRLKDTELEQYGGAFIPEFAYDVIKRLPRFASMQVSVQLVLHNAKFVKLINHSVDNNKMPRSSWVSFWSNYMTSALVY